MPALPDQRPSSRPGQLQLHTIEHSPIKAFNNPAFEDLDDDCAPLPSPIPVPDSPIPRGEPSRGHTPPTLAPPNRPRFSQPGMSWASRSAQDPSRYERSRLSNPGGVGEPRQGRMSATGGPTFFQRSCSSRQSAAGSEVYPLQAGELFGDCDEVETIGDGDAASSDAGRGHGVEITGMRTLRAHGPSLIGYHASIKELLSTQLRQQAVHLAAPDEGLVRCYVKRARGLLGITCMYTLFLEDGDIEVMSALRSSKSKGGPSYSLYYEGDAQRAKKDAGVISMAELSPNTSGSKYTLHAPATPTSSPTPSPEATPDVTPTKLAGSRPNSGSAAQKAAAAKLQLCISFDEAVGASELRSMHCLLPNPYESAPDGTVLSSMTKLDRKDKAQVSRKLCMLCTRQPDYDEKNGYTLPVHDRYFETSVKNFQLVERYMHSAQKGTTTVMQFGKIAKDTFALDFGFPLSAKTAFAIALAATEAKYMNANL